MGLREKRRKRRQERRQRQAAVRIQNIAAEVVADYAAEGTTPTVQQVRAEVEERMDNDFEDRPLLRFFKMIWDRLEEAGVFDALIKALIGGLLPSTAEE